MYYEVQKDGFLVSTDENLLDMDAIHAYLKESYWAGGIPRDVVVKAIENSFCFGLYDQGKQIGFAAVITDFTHFAYLKDVFVLDEYQGRGLGTWLVECILACPQLQGLRRILLATSDAHDFYRKFGFESLSDPARLMEKTFDRSWYQGE